MLSSTRAMTCSNLWCSWVRRAVGLDSRAFTTWPGRDRKEKHNKDDFQWLSSIHASVNGGGWKSATCLDIESRMREKGRAAEERLKCFSLSSCLHACLHTTKAFALHIYTKPTSAMFFMPNSCHRVSGIYGLLAAARYKAEQTELGRENRQSGAIHRALWIRV